MKYAVVAAYLLFLTASARMAAQQPFPQPLSLKLGCSKSDCPVLYGVPQTTGMRSGFVRLQPGQSVGAHSTRDHEEALVILRGKGTAEIEGRKPIPFTSQMLIYIPPRTRHNVTNTGRQLLEYVYVVSPARKKID
jgi:mannose-6-phosphate isomerase-like protein (cupin superfamily)